MQNRRVIARKRDAESERLECAPRNLKRQREERARARAEDKGERERYRGRGHSNTDKRLNYRTITGRLVPFAFPIICWETVCQYRVLSITLPSRFSDRLAGFPQSLSRSPRVSFPPLAAVSLRDNPSALLAPRSSFPRPLRRRVPPYPPRHVTFTQKRGRAHTAHPCACTLRPGKMAYNYGESD